MWVQRKIFQEGPTEQKPKNSKKRPKMALLSLFPGGRGTTEKRSKNSK